MGLSSTLAGHRVTSARAWLPAWGLWFAEVSLDGEHDLSGRVTLTLADLPLVGTVLSGGPAKGRSHFWIVAGAGGWGREIAADQFLDDNGVKVARVIQSAATACGETLDPTTLPAARTGPSYTRRKDAACRVLEMLAPGAWYVGEDGVTRLGSRGTSTLAASVPRVSPVDLARRTVTLAPESALGIVPGLVVDGLEAVDVVHELSETGLRSTIWGGRDGEGDRGLVAFRALVEQLFPQVRYAGSFEYRVVTLDGDRLNLQPVRVSAGLPSLRRVPVRPGLAGSKSTLALGSRVFVMFADNDPSRPGVVGFEDASGEGFLPVLTEIDASTFVRLADGARLMAATGDLAGGVFPIVGTTRVMG